MAKFLLLWEMERAKIPESPKDRGIGTKMLLELVKQDLKAGRLKDWGVFAGEHAGYSVVDGTEMDVLNLIQRYTPFVFFKTRPIASVTHIDKMIEVLIK
jgi:hypothetical protein